MDRTRDRLGAIGGAPGLCLVAIGVYAAVALAILPEGAPSPAARLVALAIIFGAVVVAVAVARWGPRWLRAIGMILIGFSAVAVLFGVVAERLLRTPSVASILGLLAGLAGVVLVVLGWRRLLLGMRRRWARVAVAAVGSLVILQMLVLPAVVALLVTNRARPEASGRTPADLNLAFDDVRIAVADGTALAGWWIPSEGSTAVIVLPGSGSTRDDVLDHAAFVARAGHGVLLLDVRGHGDSEGRLMDLGWDAHRDVSDVVAWLEARGVERVGLFGLSMGGEIALTAAADDPRVDGVVAEGATARTYHDGTLVPEANPIASAVSWIQFAMIRVLAPESEPAPLIDAVARIEAPTLLIEGNGPLEEEVGPMLDEAAPAAFTLWAIPESPHVGGLSTRPDEYRDRVLALFEDALG